MELEGAGIPTALVVTAPFAREVEALRAALGLEGLVPVVIAHPLSTLSDAEIGERARAAAPQAAAVWRGEA